VTPAAQEWLQGALLDAVAMELVCSSDSPEPGAPAAIKYPQELQQRVAKLSDPLTAPQIPLEAPFAPSLLHALCAPSLTMLASSWARFLAPADAPIALGLLCKSQLDAELVNEPAPPPHSLITPQTRSHQMQWLWECILTMRSHREDGITSLLTTLDVNLPPLTPECLEALPRCLVDWTSGTPLCPGDAPQFLSLRRSAQARGRVVSALMLITAAISDIPDGSACPVLAALHAPMGVVKGGGLEVLVRAVGTAVTWTNSVRAGIARTACLGEACNISDATAELYEATSLLRNASGALCALVGALLKVPSSRTGVRATAPMHARWRVVCHMLLAAYNATHWTPDNLQVRQACLCPCCVNLCVSVRTCDAALEKKADQVKALPPPTTTSFLAFSGIPRSLPSSQYEGFRLARYSLLPPHACTNTFPVIL
jgi:hypothetical protein